jgi:hypothetical protein
MNCKAPQCEYSKRWKKCVKPNAYIEALAWCKRNKIDHQKCKKDYNSEEAKKEACKRYEERHNKVSSLKKTDDAANKIKKFIKRRVVQRAETLQNRISYYNAVQYYLKDVKDNYRCLQPITIQSNGILLDGFEIEQTDIRLIRKIGSKSEYGVIYRTGGKNVLLSIASKLMPVNTTNTQEIHINTKVANLVLNNLSRHFLLSYKTFQCNQISKRPYLPPLLKKGQYFVALNELAHGDLQSLCTEQDFLSDNDTVFNVAIQVMFSVLTFHMTGYSHNDCHWGNFLYHRNKTVNGYYHYIVNGKNIYLKSCKYNMMIYDFGFARPDNIIGTYKKFFIDYVKGLMAFMRKSDKGWVSSQHLDSGFSTYMKRIWNTIYKLDPLMMNNEEQMFESVILPLFKNSPYNNNILSDNVPSRQVINKKPFIINKNNFVV